MVECNIINACKNGDIEYVDNFVKNGNNINTTYGLGWTPLTISIEHERKEMIEFLLQNGADVNFISEGWPALHTAIDLAIDSALQEGNNDIEASLMDIILLLLKNGADVDLEVAGVTPISMASEYMRNHNGFIPCEKIVTLLREYSKK